jgi:cell division protein FtsB
VTRAMPPRSSEPEPRSGRPVLTGRALVLGGIVVLLVLLLASPIHRFLASRSDVSSTAQQLAQDNKQLRDLKQQQALWSDPGFIQQQARRRLQFAMPGDTVYVVVDKGQRSDIEKTAGAASSKPGGTEWNTRLWDSVRAAGK